MARVVIVGGGLAGLAAAASLGEAGLDVDLYEARPFLGGRAASYHLPGGETIDNCQHVLLGCCDQLLAFYRRLGCVEQIRFHKEFYFIEPGGRISTLRAGRLPAPAHFTESFLGMRCLSAADKIAVARALFAIRAERTKRTDLDQITFLHWLEEKKQTARAIERFWRQVLVSAVNEDLNRMAASHGFQVFWRGFLASKDAYEMGVPDVPLGELYSERAWWRWPNVKMHLRNAVRHVVTDGGLGVALESGIERADAVIVAVPFERVTAVAPRAGLSFDTWEHSPITGIHLWFDQPVTELPHGTLLDRTIHWFFNKGSGRYLQLVVSASRSMIEMSRSEIIELSMRELQEFLPLVRDARLERAHVVKEVRATFSAKPGLRQPGNETPVPGLLVAGDWTDTGWPATMEGAVRSGNRAAEAVQTLLGGTRTAAATLH